MTDALIREVLDARPDLAAAWEGNRARREMALALRLLRKRAGLTQAQLGARAGWTQSFVSRLEAVTGGLHDPETLDRYAQACGATASIVFAMSDAPEDVVAAVAL